MPNLLLQVLNEPAPSSRPPDQPVLADQTGVLTHSMSRLIQIIALLWIIYIAMVAGSDYWFVLRRPGTQNLPLAYHLNLVGLALVSLLLARWPAAQRRLGRAVLPVIIGCLSFFSLLITPLLLPNLTVGPISGTPGLLHMRLYPLLFIGLVLVAFLYSWRTIMGYSLGITCLLIALSLEAGQIRSIMIATALMLWLILMTLGYCISTLMMGFQMHRAQLLQANRQLADANRELQHYAVTREYLTISRERNRLARELHDTLAHGLSGLSIHLETAKAYWSVDPATARRLVDTALNSARHGLDETRRALSALRASPLDDLGLIFAIQTMSTSAAATAQLQLQLHLPEDCPPLAADLELALYRITQEAVTNVIDHADARSLMIQLTIDPAAISLVVQDDGCGFNPAQRAAAGHFGLQGIRERVALLGGICSITSKPERGTALHVSVPYTR